MESEILADMNVLRISSLVIAVVSISLLFGLVSLVEEEDYTEDSRAIESIERDGSLLAVSLIPLFVGPAAIAGFAASFLKTAKLQIIVWSAITLALWSGIMVYGLMLLTDPVSHGLPESYWDM